MSDLLSDVIAGAKEATCGLRSSFTKHRCSGLSQQPGWNSIVGGREPDPDTLKKAEDQGVPIMVSPLPAYEIAGGYTKWESGSR